MFKQSRSSESGQILILVMLVLLIGLTVGLSLAARSISNIQNSGDLDQSNRAFSAAEAGVEHVLNSNNPCPSACTVPVGSVGTANVNVTNVGGTTAGYAIDSVKQDDVAQVNLNGFSCAGSLTLYWGKNGDNSSTKAWPALVVSVLYKNGSGTYGMTKSTYEYTGASRSDNFNTVGVSADPADFPLNTQLGDMANTYGYKASLSIGSAVPSCGTNNPVLARVRLMYADNQPMAFFPAGAGVTLPTQGKLITSTANVNGKQRTVTAFQSNAQLPAIFDYALFNGSSSPLSK